MYIPISYNLYKWTPPDLSTQERIRLGGEIARVGRKEFVYALRMRLCNSAQPSHAKPFTLADVISDAAQYRPAESTLAQRAMAILFFTVVIVILIISGLIVPLLLIGSVTIGSLLWAYRKVDRWTQTLIDDYAHAIAGKGLRDAQTRPNGAERNQAIPCPVAASSAKPPLARPDVLKTEAATQEFAAHAAPNASAWAQWQADAAESDREIINLRRSDARAAGGAPFGTAQMKLRTTVALTGLATSFCKDGGTYTVSTIHRNEFCGFYQTSILKRPRRSARLMEVLMNPAQMVYRIEALSQMACVQEHIDTVRMALSVPESGWLGTKPNQDDVMNETCLGGQRERPKEMPWTDERIKRLIFAANIGYEPGILSRVFGGW